MPDTHQLNDSLLIADFDGEIKIGAMTTAVTFEVYGVARRGFSGSRETPAEPSYIDVYRVMCNGRDATDLLNDEGFARIFYDKLYQR